MGLPRILVFRGDFQSEFIDALQEGVKSLKYELVDFSQEQMQHATIEPNRSDHLLVLGAGPLDGDVKLREQILRNAEQVAQNGGRIFLAEPLGYRSRRGLPYLTDYLVYSPAWLESSQIFSLAVATNVDPGGGNSTITALTKMVKKADWMALGGIISYTLTGRRVEPRRVKCMDCGKSLLLWAKVKAAVSCPACRSLALEET